MKKIFAFILFMAGFCCSAWADLDGSGFEAHSTMHDGHIPDGIYEIVSVADSNLCWDVTGGSKDNGAEIQLYTRNHSDAQRFEIKKVKEAAATYNGISYIHYFYTIKSVNSGKYVDLNSGSLDNATKIQQWEGSGGTNNNAQMWEIDIVSDAVLYIKAYKNDGKWQPRITAGTVISGGSPTHTQGTKLKSSFYGLSKWTLVPAENQKITNIKDGATYRISAKSDPAKGIDVSGKGTTNGTNIQLWTYSAGTNQKWQFEYITEGDYANMGCYYIKAQHGDNLYAHLENGNTYGHPNVHLWSGTGVNAIWKIKEADEAGYYNFVNVNGRVMDLSNGKKEDGTNVWGHRINATDAQKFELIEVPAGDENLDSIEDGLYFIYPAGKSGVCLDVSGAGNNDGANVMLYTRSDCGKNQEWIVNNLGNGYYSIKAHHSKKALDVDGGSTEKGANVQQYASNGSEAQQWHFRMAYHDHHATSYYYIVNSKGLYLDAENLESGSNVRVWTPEYDDNTQMWGIEPVKVPKRITHAQYATLWYPDLDLQLPEGLEAFSCKLSDDKTRVETVKKYGAGDRIPKGEGVVIHKIEENADIDGLTYYFPVLIDKDKDDPVTDGNCLKSSHGDIDVYAGEGQYVYRLIETEQGVGFYMTPPNDEKGTAEGKYLRSKSHLCYLLSTFKSDMMTTTKAAPKFVRLPEE